MVEKRPQLLYGHGMAHYSHSSLSTYRTCPRKYAFRYKERESALGKTIEAVLGSSVHEALERIYADVQNGKSPTKDELIRCYDRAWKNNFKENVRIIRKEYSAQHYKEVGRRCVDNYFNHYQPFSGSKTLAIEKVLYIPVDDSARIKCIIDRIDKKEDGLVEIHDYKTSQRLATLSDAKVDMQLPLYEIAVRREFPNVEKVDLIWHYLAYDEEVRVVKQADELNAVWNATLDTIREVESATEFPTCPSQLCQWCEYQHVCPETRHAYHLANMPAEQVELDEGWKLANMYSHYYNLKKEAEAEMAAVRDLIVQYADGMGLNVVSGSEKEVVIHKKDVLKLPTKDEEFYADVERLAKDFGIYEKYSNLDMRKLAKAIGSNSLRDEIAERLKKYTTLKEEMRITLRKCKNKDSEDDLW